MGCTRPTIATFDSLHFPPRPGVQTWLLDASVGERVTYLFGRLLDLDDTVVAQRQLESRGDTAVQ